MAQGRLRRHPLSAAWNDMAPDHFAEMVEDVKANGINRPITILEGQVLDGWHRYRAALEAGMAEDAIPTEELPEGRDAADFVISENLHRRHLSKAQRAVCVLAVRGWHPPGRPAAADGEGIEERAQERTNKQLAKEAGVSVSVISQVKRAMRDGKGEDIREGTETLGTLQRKEAEERPLTPIEKLRHEVAELRETMDALRTENEELRARAEEIEETTLRRDNETLRHRVNFLQERLRREQRAHKAAQAELRRTREAATATD